jgi:CCR4-NOT transcription complex subunit 1
LNPNNYPAFAFAWLELISHKLFLPHFIKAQFNLAAYKQKLAEKVKESGNSKEAQNKTKKFLEDKQKEDMNHIVLKYHKIKDLLVSCFTFIKHNMLPGVQASASMRSFYTATMNIVLVILKDYPQFICDYHFNFVNSLPDHTI